ncbi:glycoside hydrolase [Cristinia sonorae]|uniref:beta-N-acetylhexosaminidase n=1 Tax=Cristinia sonorae TaxID=1940300 RepID=A0A8K0XMU6_9AGAR|nr:glycoside hydrolase [Cristinia sonorae]
MHIAFTLLVGALCLATDVLGASLQPQIPSVASVSLSSASGDVFQLSELVRIVVDSKSAAKGSPSLLDFAKVFRNDLNSVTFLKTILPVETSSHNIALPNLPTIFLTIDPKKQFKLFNGKPTDEGYELTTSRNSIVVTASAPIGVWWGTRTIVQQAALAAASGSKKITFPVGKVTDAPGWEVRGFMLDVGRHWFETDFLTELCVYASFFKINEFHLHASDNLWNPDFLYGEGNEGWKNLYAAFRFQPGHGSPISGLVPRKNESWTQNDFRSMQTTCAQHGVTLVPEIDTPGHSLVINQWKPQLMERGAPDHLNLSVPETIPTIKSIWDEFLPWFTSSEVSIGADEYDAKLADDYIGFVNEMSSYIHQKSGKSIRVWGTNEPSTTLSISKNVTIQHWDFPADDIPTRLMDAGYQVINSEQAFLYLDGKTSLDNQFPQELNQDLIWSGAPGGKGWAPNIFSPTDPSNNTNIRNPNLRGSIMALWNDWGNNATTRLEIYYQLSRSLAVFGEKAWSGSEVRDTALTRAQFDAVYPVLNAAAPGQNLNRVVPSRNGVVYNFNLGFNGQTTHVDSVGPPYTMTFSVIPSSRSPSQGLLFSGIDSKLHVANLTFEATGKLYPLGYTLPLGKWTKVAIHATREYTYAVINDDASTKRFWTTTMDLWGSEMAVGNMSFAAPSKTFGGDGFSGSIKDISIVLGA